MRIRVLSKEWKIDGEGKPPRMPTTHREIAQAIALLLEEREDIHAMGHTSYDNMMLLMGVVVQYYQRRSEVATRSKEETPINANTVIWRMIISQRCVLRRLPIVVKTQPPVMPELKRMVPNA